MDFESETFIAHALRADGFDASEDGTGRGTPLVACPLTQNQYGDNESRESLLVPVIAPCLTQNYGKQPDNSDTNSGLMLLPVAIQERAICENPNAGPDGAGVRQDGLAYTLEARSVPQAVAFDCKSSGRNGFGIGDVSPTLRAMGHVNTPQNAGGQVAVAAAGMAVRRLTPRECERLQGFPDDYTKISAKTADGPRYKALGNSMAVPVMRWIGERIAMVDLL
jgi:DNA (cytosine-5)-methyltransferase 1